MKRLLVNDMLTAIPGTRTFWHDLQEWFDMGFVGGDYKTLADTKISYNTNLIIRNATWFGPLKASLSTIRDACNDCNGPIERCGKHGDVGEPPMGMMPGVPTISLLQDIFTEGPQREMQKAVIQSSSVTVFNSEFTKSKYETPQKQSRVIPLPVDFDLFQPGNPMGLQQLLSLPDNCICWIGASQGAAGQVKGYDTFLTIVRTNPDINFVAVFKDAIPPVIPPNMRAFCRLPQEELVKIIGACRVGLCTSRIESQHLAGIEMGACGLPMVAPEVGTYWKRDIMPGKSISEPTIETCVSTIRKVLGTSYDPENIRQYWEYEFSKPVIKAKWKELIDEIETS